MGWKFHWNFWVNLFVEILKINFWYVKNTLKHWCIQSIRGLFKNYVTMFFYYSHQIQHFKIIQCMPSPCGFWNSLSQTLLCINCSVHSEGWGGAKSNFKIDEREWNSRRRIFLWWFYCKTFCSRADIISAWLSMQWSDNLINEFEYFICLKVINGSLKKIKKTYTSHSRTSYHMWVDTSIFHS